MAIPSTLVDRVKIFTTSSGTGPFTLGDAVPAFRGVEALTNGLIYSYAAENGSDFEVGQGQFVSDTNQLIRTVFESSLGAGAPVPFPANVAVNFTALASDLSGTGSATDAAASAAAAALSTQSAQAASGVATDAANAAADAADAAADSVASIGTAVEDAEAAASEAVAAAATVGTNTGNPASRGSIGGINLALSSQQRSVLNYSVPARGAVSNQFLSLRRARMRRASIAWGHSAVSGSGVVLAGAGVKPTSGIAGSFPRLLEFQLKEINPEHSVANRGQSAQRSDEIASRMAAIPMNITLSSGTTLPPATVAACTTSPGVNGPSNQRNNAPDVYAGKIYGQPCLLKAVDNTSTNPKQYTIEQVEGTSTITILPGTPFWRDPFDTDYGINIIWATKNDPTVQLSIDMVGAMVCKLPQDERRFFIIGDWPFANGSQDAGSTAHNDMLTKNAKLRELYGSDFFDPYAFLRGDYPYNGLIYPSIWQMTGESPTQAANDWVTPGDWVTLGRIPRRWMSIYLGGSDVNHFNEQTYWWLGKAAIDFYYRPRGWL